MTQAFFPSAVLPADLATDSRYALAVLLNDLIDQTVLLGLLSRHNEVALHVLLDFFDRLPAMVSQELVDHRPHSQNLLRVDCNVGRLAGQPRHRGLVDEDA